MKKISNYLLSSPVIIALALLLLPNQALAQSAACEQDIVVQADDWLSKIADKVYGDILAFPAIVDATNAAAVVDSSYTAIANPDLIEPGWKLCVPGAGRIAEGADCR